MNPARISVPRLTLPLLLAGALQSHGLPTAQPTPFTLEVPPAALLSESPINTLPLWAESISIQKIGTQKFIRLRLRKIASIIKGLELRISLNPGSGPQALVTGWSESGQQKFASKPFGTESERITEVIRIPSTNIDYVDLELPGDGSRLASFFATAMRESPVLHPIDFGPSPAIDAFTESPKNLPGEDKDLLLLGRVAALLDAGPFQVSEGDPTSICFDLSKVPSAALISYEVRNILANQPPSLSVNAVNLTNPSMLLPDLADPAWKLRREVGLPESSLQYSGWIRIQHILPATALLQGTNELLIQQPAFAGSAEVRNVRLQIRNFR